jgi:glyoxylase-like metal-dependent hydrolase (beta-lactamase superfamily II)
MIQIVGSVAAGVILAGCTPAVPEQQFLNDALRAVGGRERVAAVKTVLIEGAGVNYNLGQDMRPEAATQAFAITGYTRKIDVANGRQRIEQTRTPKFAYFQGMQPQTQVQGIDGEVGFNVNASGEPSRMAPQAERDRHTEFFQHPITALRAALDGTATIGNVRSIGAVRQADFKSAGAEWTMTIDPAGLPLSTSTRTYHPNLGDVIVTTTFADYQETNGLKLPETITGSVDEFTTWETHATRQSIDSDVGDLAAPAGLTARAGAPVPPNVTVQQLAKGVWLLGGQSHHSALIEFGDHLMLIDAPQSEARTLAVIAKAKQLVPDKSLSELVLTHHHFDHTAGMRAAIYSGLSVITHAGNKEWVDNMARRPHTIQQDMLAKNVSRLNLNTVDDEREFTDQSMTVMLYHVAGNPHSDTMLMAYIPRDRIVIQVDAFSPGPGPGGHPYAANLLENIQKRNLRVDTIVPLHGVVTPFAELVKVAGGARTN